MICSVRWTHWPDGSFFVAADNDLCVQEIAAMWRGERAVVRGCLDPADQGVC